MRITILVPNLAIGGAERAMVYLANGLADLGHGTEMLVLDDSGPLRDEIDDSVRVVSLGSGSMVLALPALRRYLRARKPEALVSTLTYANIVSVLAAKLSRSGVRVFVREATTLSRSGGTDSFKGKVVDRLARWFYTWADGVIAVSEGVAEDLTSNYGVPPDSIRVIYNPAFPPNLEDYTTEAVDHPWFEQDSIPTILAVGRLTLAKDYPTLIRAFAKVRQSREARLVILGDGQLRDELMALVEQRGLSDSVQLPGFARNPYGFMARSSLFVLSSAWEGMPNALIQAMACGCPVVATDCKSGPREVLEGGRHGRLVPVGDDDRLAEAILETLNDPPAPDVVAAGVERFARDRICTQYLDYVGPP